jgi:hypothetical protein
LFRSNYFWLSYGSWTCIFCSNLKLSRLFFEMAITQPKVIQPERNSSFNCNSSRNSQRPNIKSIYQRTSRKSLDNLKFKQKYKFKGHNSAKYHLFGWAMTLELVFLFKFQVVRTFSWRPLIYWLDIWPVAISRWVTV